MSDTERVLDDLRSTASPTGALPTDYVRAAQAMVGTASRLVLDGQVSEAVEVLDAAWCLYRDVLQTRGTLWLPDDDEMLAAIDSAAEEAAAVREVES